MPCTGPAKDDRIGKLVVEELKKIRFFQWPFIRVVRTLEDAADAALTKQHGSRPTSCLRSRMIAHLTYGMLVGKQPGEIDWDEFRNKLDEGIWTFDAADF
jgi:hypothetical protein